VINEAPMEKTEYGLLAAAEGWFVVNVRDAAWVTNERLGEACILLLVEGEERRLKAWDFVHCPPGTEHIFVGAGDGPCLIFMAGAREHRGDHIYTRSEVAIRHGAGLEKDTLPSEDPYGAFPDWRPGPPASFEGLPFA
jgi:hypothetical protein